MEQIEEERDINSLSRTSHAFHRLANPCLYSRHARRRHDSYALCWAAEHDRIGTAKKLLAAGADP
ncbi:hypothetical protein IMZ48_47080 [Candidatus Bathyarchaeota archaeon]|nr:hypothetical protein [Candidatus Bathyarchaeota archaeon]